MRTRATPQWVGPKTLESAKQSGRSIFYVISTCKEEVRLETCKTRISQLDGVRGHFLVNPPRESIRQELGMGERKGPGAKRERARILFTKMQGGRE